MLKISTNFQGTSTNSHSKQISFKLKLPRALNFGRRNYTFYVFHKEIGANFLNFSLENSKKKKTASNSLIIRKSFSFATATLFPYEKSFSCFFHNKNRFHAFSQANDSRKQATRMQMLRFVYKQLTSTTNEQLI